MPCYEVRLVSVEFSMESKEALKATAKVLGLSVYQPDKNTLYLGDQFFLNFT